MQVYLCDMGGTNVTDYWEFLTGKQGRKYGDMPLLSIYFYLFLCLLLWCFGRLGSMSTWASLTKGGSGILHFARRDTTNVIPIRLLTLSIGYHNSFRDDHLTSYMLYQSVRWRLHASQRIMHCLHLPFVKAASTLDRPAPY